MKYMEKDMRKWENCNAFIGYGSKGSSTEYYRTVIWPRISKKINTGWQEGDVIGISVNGNRPGRMKAPWGLIENAASVEGIAFITDKKKDRERTYNIGEREVAAFLKSLYFEEIEDGFWTLL